jgi:hypothetical protein
VKAKTHNIFSAGTTFYLLSLLGSFSLASAAMALWLSFSVNFLIDAAGHSRGRSGGPSRTRLTHSVFTAPLWGAAVGFASIYVASHAGVFPIISSLVWFWALVGVLIAFGHLFLDSLTQAGVYYWKHRIARLRTSRTTTYSSTRGSQRLVSRWAS